MTPCKHGGSSGVVRDDKTERGGAGGRGQGRLMMSSFCTESKELRRKVEGGLGGRPRIPHRSLRNMGGIISVV